MKSQVLDNLEGNWATIGGDLPSEELRSYIATVNDILYLVVGESSNGVAYLKGNLILEWDPVKEEWLEQGCISCGMCSYPELTKDHMLTSAYVYIFRTVTRNAVNKSV